MPDPSLRVTTVSFERDILPLFRPMDIQCMRGRKVFLADYKYMSERDSSGAFANATDVLRHLTGEAEPRMPFGGPYWSDESIGLFQSWMNGGCQP
jgi:hypothetical protein